MVDALAGGPGVFSARYSGPEATDESNNRKLLQELADMPIERRTAQFVCHICLADPSGAVQAESEACCRGRILFSPAGRAASATIRSSKSPNTIARSAN